MDETQFTLRLASWNDLKAVAELTREVRIADGNAFSAKTLQEWAREWKSEGFTLETDAWVALTEDKRVVGFEEFNHRQAHAFFNGEGYIHPDYCGLGIGTALLRKLTERAVEEMKLAKPDLRIYIRNGISAADQSAREIHEHEGYKPIRRHWKMEINLADAPQIKPFPKGIELRPFDKDSQNMLVFEVENEAFRDHWGNVPAIYSNWKMRKLEREEFDPTLWHVAWDGDQIAGYAQTRYRNGIGWVGNLGVRRPWRKRGLGEALMLHSFNEFYKRGMMQIGLGVDASNPTGAVRLYQKVGMQIAVEGITYEKELRAGRELNEQE